MANIKGSLLLNRLKYIEEKLTEDQKESIFSRLSEECRNELKKALTITWHPFSCAIELSEVMYQVMSDQKPDVLYEMGDYSAWLSSRGIYRIFFKLLSVEAILKRATQLWSALMKPGRCYTIKKAAGNVDFILEEFDEVVPQVFVQSLQGWAKGIMEVSGAKNVSTIVRKASTPEDHSLVLNVRWS